MTNSTAGKINLCDGTFRVEHEVDGGVKREGSYRLRLLCLTDNVQIIN